MIPPPRVHFMLFNNVPVPPFVCFRISSCQLGLLPQLTVKIGGFGDCSHTVLSCWPLEELSIPFKPTSLASLRANIATPLVPGNTSVSRYRVEICGATLALYQHALTDYVIFQRRPSSNASARYDASLYPIQISQEFA